MNRVQKISYDNGPMLDERLQAGANLSDVVESTPNQNRDLSWKLQYLERNQVYIEGRVERLENSLLFRGLRSIGRIFNRLGSLMRRGPDPRTTALTYTDWVKETMLEEVFNRALSDVAPSTHHQPVNVLLPLGGGGAESVSRMLSSLNGQRHLDWRLFLCTTLPLPEWLKRSISGAGLDDTRIHVFSATSIREAIARAVEETQTEFVAIVSEKAILEPCALQSWLSSVRTGSTVAYSDWDHVSREGLFHTPRFTPEFSPELLRHTLYWGECFLARTEAIRKVGWPSHVEGEFLAYQLALRLSEATDAVVRVPQITWHLQDEVSTLQGSPLVRKPAPGENSAFVEDESIPPSDASASVIICSRSAKRLERCLKSLMPTLDSRHEVIVVAHQNAETSLLSDVAQRYKTALIPYRGAFHFGVMNKKGVLASNRPFLIFLNDDTKPLSENWAKRILSQASRRDVGVVGALLLYPSGAIQHAGVVVGGQIVPAHAGRFQRESPYWPWLRITREVTAVTGACLALRRNVWDELGGFNPLFPSNFNDVDLCLRARQQGYRIILEAGAVLVHEEAATRVAAIRTEERKLFYELWHDVIERPDDYFSPEIELSAETICLKPLWTRLR